MRSIGGKNILLLGGAAIAGAMAVDKMSTKSGESQPAAPPPPPLPPPIPATQATPPLPPPIPQPEAAEPEIPETLVLAIVRTMVAGALADGEMHAEEKKLIESRLGESGLSPEHIRQIQKDMVIPPGPAEIAGLVEEPSDRELLYRFGALVVLADESTSELETAWLTKLADALGIDDEKRRTMDRELFQTES